MPSVLSLLCSTLLTDGLILFCLCACVLLQHRDLRKWKAFCWMPSLAGVKSNIFTSLPKSKTSISPESVLEVLFHINLIVDCRPIRLQRTSSATISNCPQVLACINLAKASRARHSYLQSTIGKALFCRRTLVQHPKTLL